MRNIYELEREEEAKSWGGKTRNKQKVGDNRTLENWWRAVTCRKRVRSREREYSDYDQRAGRLKFGGTRRRAARKPSSKKRATFVLGVGPVLSKEDRTGNGEHSREGYEGKKRKKVRKNQTKQYAQRRPTRQPMVGKGDTRQLWKSEPLKQGSRGVKGWGRDAL